MRWRVGAAAVLVSVFAVPMAAVGAHAEDDEVFAFDDARIIESSGLVDLGRLMVTTNDSGDSARVFTVDARTGRTVGVTDYDAEAVDVEALAPAGGSAVWVGDIGDNDAARDDVSVYRVPVAPRQLDVPDPESYTLRYSDGPHNAESLLATPGALWVITKSLTGGTVYRTSGALRRTGVNKLRPVARVDDFATDAALLGDGRHVLVRSPAQASVYTFPGFEVVGRFPLPRQRQGEGISVGPGERIRLSSEGRDSPVLQVDLPADLAGRLSPSAATPRPGATAAPGDTAAASPVPPAVLPERPDPGYRSSTVLGWAAAAAVVVAAIGVAIVLRRQR